ncbi:TIGR03862 family flavoprotein [Caenimonas soli]|uniref:TIGR03862 family flavoprotein n=1 Tax=Caenimonas soli TaxID=2735555 RepID=UPI001557DDE2|nr:TIGR03862 family flavoprotein [Caenimonas soli]NPC54421.1 TIGR03862 family flavoprotein [Caenimonas soli]
MTLAVVGAGPAGLMAAEVLSQAGLQVEVFDAMPSVGRKFLLAGKGGLNLTHSEPFEPFASRYGARRAQIEPLLEQFGAQALRDWAQGLGIATFVGTSGRVFPSEMKAAPLLRAWLQRLRGAGVQFHMRHRFTGWTEDGALQFEAPQGERIVRPEATMLALGGASWARLGSDGAWVPLLEERGVSIAPLLPSNCGFDVRGGWTEYFATRFAGQPFKSVAIRFQQFHRQGEFVATATGVEGSLIYAASAQLRDEIAARGSATFELDLLPARSAAQVLAEVAHPRGSRSLSSHLKSRLGLEGIKMAVLHELVPKPDLHDAGRLASAIKALPLTVVAARPIDEAISTAGGVRFEALDKGLMLREVPGVFCAGEMLDWEAPTGGYLLTASFATGRAAALGLLSFLGVRAAA